MMTPALLSNYPPQYISPLPRIWLPLASFLQSRLLSRQALKREFSRSVTHLLFSILSPKARLAGIACLLSLSAFLPLAAFLGIVSCHTRVAAAESFTRTREFGVTQARDLRTPETSLWPP